MLELTRITKKFADETVLDSVTITVPDGQFLLLSGENGAGKSTLLLSAAGLLRPDSGDVLFNGLSLYKSPIKQPNGKIAYVPQEPALITGFSVADNLNFWGDAARLTRKQRELKKLELIEALSLKDILHKKISHLSGGMKKRVNLAVSLLYSPELLLLDEPFANVDSETKTAIYTQLQIRKQLGCCIILVSHMDETAQNLADKTIILSKGQIYQG